MVLFQAFATPFVVASLLQSKAWGFLVASVPVFFTTGRPPQNHSTMTLLYWDGQPPIWRCLQ
eukprot:1100710-Amphidinium_carterae.1